MRGERQEGKAARERQQKHAERRLLRRPACLCSDQRACCEGGPLVSQILIRPHFRDALSQQGGSQKMHIHINSMVGSIGLYNIIENFEADQVFQVGVGCTFLGSYYIFHCFNLMARQINEG